MRYRNTDYALTASSLRDLREYVRLERADFAREIGVPVDTLARWEKGVQSPTPKRQKKIVDWARKYKVDVCLRPRGRYFFTSILGNDYFSIQEKHKPVEEPATAEH